MTEDTTKTHLILESLDKKTLKLFCFLAYHGDDIDPNRLGGEYRKKTHMSKSEYDDNIDKLIKGGLLQGKTFVHQRWHISVLKELYTHHKEWISTFRDIRTYTRSSTAEYLCKVVEYILAGDYLSASSLRRPFIGVGRKQFNLMKYLLSSSEEDIRFIRMLNDDEKHEMINEILSSRFIQDEVDKELLDTLEKIIPPVSPHKAELKDEIGAYRYFQYGIPPAPSSNPTMWSESVRAIRLLYAGNLSDSKDAFDEALRLEGKRTSFSMPLLNYLYGITLFLATRQSAGQSSIPRLRAFRSDRAIKYDDENFCIRLLLEGLSGNESEVARGDYICRNHHEKLYNSFLFLLYHVFDRPVEQLTPESLHTAAILQHEMSAFLLIGPKAKQALLSAFGGTPLLSRLNRRPVWEKALNDISDSLKRIPKAERRIAYFLDGFNLTAVMEQEKEDDGWTDGKVLSLSEMSNTGYDSMDPTDMLIASKLNSSNGYDGAGKVIIPLLAESGRLLHGNIYESEHETIVVKKARPYLAFDGKGAYIQISSNVELDETGHPQRHTLTQTSQCSYSLVTVNALEKDVLSRFLSLRQIPSSAVVSLRRAIESVKGIIEVRDSNLDSLMLPPYQSKGIIAVRVVPKDQVFNITLMAIAMENGKERFVPGDGDELVYDEVDYVTHSVNRDLSREYSNYLYLTDFLKEKSDAEFHSFTELRLSLPESLLQLLAFVYDNQDRYFIEWPEGKALKFRGDVKPSDIDISVKSGVDWFKLEGEVKTNKLHLTLNALIHSICTNEIEGFVKLSDDEYVRMSEELKRHIAALDSLPSRHHTKRAIPKYQIGALAKMIQGLKVTTDKGYSDFMEKAKSAYAIAPSPPAGLTAELRDYQLEGFRWMCRLSSWGAGACLADDMGLGKTLQAITFMLHKAEEGPSLVVAPKSVLPNWKKETARFAPGLNVISLNEAGDRVKSIEQSGKNDVVLCSYGVLTTQIDHLKRRQWNVVCLDEAHQIKNRNTNASHSAMELKTKDKLILTGTPLQNHLGELWNLFQFINPGLLGSWNVFRDTFMIPGLDGEHKSLLKEMTLPFILRRTKEEVLTELPEKLVSEKMVELTDDEQTVYEEMRRRAEVKFKSRKSKAEREEAKSLDINFFSELTKLRLAACSMRLVYDEWTDKSSKISALMELLDNLTAIPDNNIIVFSQFTSFLELVKPELKNKRLEFLYLDGQTPLEKREQMVEDFQEGRCRLFLSSLKAGGLGINLTRANYVILLDPWWNPAIENQAMDRAHRIGQKRVVSIIRLICAQTIEEKILRLHDEKQHLADDVLEGTGESGRLTYEDVIDMVSPF